MTAPQITVVLPAHNVQATIGESIDSVLAQTHRDLELVVVDDGSTDATMSVAQRRFDARCRLIRQPKAGPAAARNRGAAETKAPFVAWIDGDDVWAPSKLSAQLGALCDRPDATMAYGWADVVDEALRFVCPDLRAVHDGDVYADLLARNFIYSGSNTLMRAASFRQVGGFDERLWGAEDWELHTRMARAGEVMVVPKVVVQYRQRVGSLRTDLDGMAAAYELAATAVFDAAPPELARLRSRSDAAFWFYLAGQATQTGAPIDLLRAARLGGRALRVDPLGTLGLVRSSSPIAAARLAAHGWRTRQRPS